MSDQKVYQTIKQHIADAAAAFQLSLQPSEVGLEHPANPEFGDISTNIALTNWKHAKKENGENFSNPREFATALKEKISSNQDFSVDNVAGPGFINIRISETKYIQHVSLINEKKGDVISKSFQGTRITTEFTDPNPFKEFHIGHLYSNAVGESISRLLEAVGADVRRVCYQGDVGMHVAKAIWGIYQLLEEKNSSLVLKKLQEKAKDNITQRVQFLGKAYAKGATAYEDEPTSAEEMKQLNKKIFQKEPEVFPIYELGKQWSLEYFDTIYARLGTKFEHYYFESQVGGRGIEIVKEFLSKGIFEESQGAVIFPGSKYHLHDRVFINSLGLPTYEAKELGLAPTKYDDWAYDISIIITGNEIKEYFKVLLKALSLIRPELAEKTKHLSHGMVRLPEGKMSSRKGNVLTGEWLLDEAKKMILTILDQNGRDFSLEEKNTIAEIVSISAIKYALLKNNIGGDIAFNFEESVSFDGNSGPYIQYTYARGKSVLQKADYLPNSLELPQRYTFVKEERSLLRLLFQFDEVVQEAAQGYTPHVICTYLFELAQTFNAFYNTVQILKAENEEQKNFRLQLTEATTLVLQKGLQLLGIKTVEQM